MELLSNEESSVKFLLTLNMPSAAGMLVHQVTIELGDIKSCDDLCELLNEQDFICATQWYKRQYNNGEVTWQNRGDVIINTAHIGKIQEFYENEDAKHDESHRNYEPSRSYAQVARGPVRPR